MKRRLLVSLGAALVTAAAGAAVALVPSSVGAATSPSMREVTMPGFGGTPLHGLVFTPAGTGRFPLIVMPSSWGVNQLEYGGAAHKLAAHGFVVVSYTSRGFYESGGSIDVAGPATVADVSKVIDWALANTPADPAHVGSAGVSYGAGNSLLAAERDPRIKAVSAMSGWGSLYDSVASNNTLSQGALAVLVGSAAITSGGRIGPDLSRMTAEYLAGQYDRMRADFRAFSPVRSPITDVEALNAHHTAVLLANGMQDSIFPTNEYVDFFNRITGPKRLQLEPGDHAGPEGSGLMQQPNAAWDSTTAWFEHYLKGVDNGIDSDGQVHLKDVTTGVWSSYPTWSDVSSGDRRLRLGAGPASLLSPTGVLSAGNTDPWSSTIQTGIPSTATSGVPMMGGYFTANGAPQPVYLPTVVRQAAAVWQSQRLTSNNQISGSPVLHLTATPSARTTGLIAYLFDVQSSGYGSLVTWKPYLLQGEAGSPQAVDLPLDAVQWTVPAGHSLALVIGTVDPRYTDESTIGQRVTFSASRHHAATLTLPID